MSDIIEHPRMASRLKLVDFRQHPPARANCIFRQCRVYPSRYYPVNEAAKRWRNIMTGNLYLREHQIEESKYFVEIEMEQKQ